MARFGPRIARLEGESSLAAWPFREGDPVKYQTTTTWDSRHTGEGSGSPSHPAVFLLPIEASGSSPTPTRQRNWARRHGPTPRTYVSAATLRGESHQRRESAWPSLTTQNEDAFLGALQALAHALQAKDPYTAGHSLRVAAIAKAMAQGLGHPGDEVRQIGFAAELHDIGKIGVPESLLQKRARLTDGEYAVVMRHTIIGEEIVAPLLQADPTVRQVVRWHHEHVDGSGANPAAL